MGKLVSKNILKISVLGLFLLVSVMGFSKPKLVTIDGAVTEIVVALGAADEIVGRDSTSLFPKSITALPDVGYLRALSVISPVFVHSTSHRFWSEIVMGSAVPSRLNGSPRHNEHATAKRNSVSIPDKN